VTKLFDSHAHIISDDFDKYPLASDPSVRDKPLQPFTAVDLLREMDACNVERALLVQRGQFYGFDNRYVVDSAEKYPDRLSAMCMVNGLSGTAAQDIRYWVRERGAIAVRMMEPYRGSGPEWFTSEPALQVWDTVSELGISLRLHYFNWAREAGLPVLCTLLEKYRSMPVVVDHLTSPDPEAGPAGIDDLLIALAGCPNARLLVSTINFRRLTEAACAAPDVLARVLEVFGSGRLMWGSDIAQSTGAYADMVQLALDGVSGLPAADRADILYSAGIQLYGIGH
jgi:L-fuconolactonase